MGQVAPRRVTVVDENQASVKAKVIALAFSFDRIGFFDRIGKFTNYGRLILQSIESIRHIVPANASSSNGG